MKTAVIYKSRYGSTETYAKWIAEDLEADLLQADSVKPADLDRYEVIVYGGGLYAGRISGVRLLTKNVERIKDKKLCLFTVGLTDVADPKNGEAIRSGLEKSLPPELFKRLRLYHFRGGMFYSKMGFFHRLVMRIMASVMRKQQESGSIEGDWDFAEKFGQDIDLASRAAIAPLVKDVIAGLPPQ